MKKIKYDLVEVTASDTDILKVLKHQRNQAEAHNDRLASTEQITENAIADCEKYLRYLGYSAPRPPACCDKAPLDPPPIRSWSEILADAEQDVHTEVSLVDLLTTSEIEKGGQTLSLLRAEFDAEHRLDGLDWTIAGVAGVLAALVDTFLVKIPSSPSLLGGKGTSGGALSDYIRDRVKNVFTPEQIHALEQSYRVPYDAPTSENLFHKVCGLNPRSHRFQSLGHDPILGFLFGIYDIFHGTMTAVSNTGELIINHVSSPDAGMNLFQAITLQFGHLLSDVSTEQGLPAPLMPLIQFLQVGSIGKNGMTVGEYVRGMYGRGYNFSHLLAMSFPVIMIEVLVRSGYCVKRLFEGYELMDALPINLPGKRHQPKLQTMLFVAHLISTSVNAGRVYLTGNPLAINYPQWMMMAKMSLQQLNWAFFDKEAERFAFVQSKIDQDWDAINRDLAKWWERNGSDPGQIQ